MPHVQRSALVPHSARAMFDLVNDVARYPEFLPWCAASTVREESGEVLIAELEISRAGVQQKFATRNALVPGEQMTLELVEGPFEHFVGQWRFKALTDEACRVELELDFEYANRIVRTALGPLFNKAADTMVDAFCARAKQLYGDGMSQVVRDGMSDGNNGATS